MKRPARSKRWHLEYLGIEKADCPLCKMTRRRKAKRGKVTLDQIVKEFGGNGGNQRSRA